MTPQDREEEAGSLRLRILPDAAAGSAQSCLCQGLLRGSLGEERDLVPAQRGAKLRQEAWSSAVVMVLVVAQREASH